MVQESTFLINNFIWWNCWICSSKDGHTPAYLLYSLCLYTKTHTCGYFIFVTKTLIQCIVSNVVRMHLNNC